MELTLRYSFFFFARISSDNGSRSAAAFGLRVRAARDRVGFCFLLAMAFEGWWAPHRNCLCFF